MKKLLFMAFLGIFISASSLYAEEIDKDRDQIWFTMGYGYYFSEAAKGSSLGPFTATVGVKLWKWLALDMSLGYVWSLDYDGDKDKIATDLDFFPVRAVLMYQPNMKFNTFSLRPYIGAGPMFAINGTNYSNSNFSGGFAAKAGLRIAYHQYLFGLGLEYLFNRVHITENNIKYNYNASGVSLGAEIGFTF